MEPLIQFKRGCLLKNTKPDDFCIGEGDNDLQIKIQIERESKILSKIYYQEENIPKGPAMELMKTCDAKLKQITKGGSLSQYYKKIQMQQQEELKAKLWQRKNLLSKLLKIEGQSLGMNLNELQQKLDQETIDKLGSAKLAQLSSHINKWEKDSNVHEDKGVASHSQYLNDSTPYDPLQGMGMDDVSEIPFLNTKTRKISDGILSEESVQHTNYLKGLSKNYRTTSCKNYHAEQGCGRGMFCHFIHLPEFEGTNIFSKNATKLAVVYCLNLKSPLGANKSNSFV